MNISCEILLPKVLARPLHESRRASAPQLLFSTVFYLLWLPAVRLDRPSDRPTVRPTVRPTDCTKEHRFLGLGSGRRASTYPSVQPISAVPTLERAEKLEKDFSPQS